MWSSAASSFLTAMWTRTRPIRMREGRSTNRRTQRLPTMAAVLGRTPARQTPLWMPGPLTRPSGTQAVRTQRLTPVRPDLPKRVPRTQAAALAQPVRTLASPPRSPVPGAAASWPPSSRLGVPTVPSRRAGPGPTELANASAPLSRAVPRQGAAPRTSTATSRTTTAARPARATAPSDPRAARRWNQRSAAATARSTSTAASPPSWVEPTWPRPLSRCASSALCAAPSLRVLGALEADERAAPGQSAAEGAHQDVVAVTHGAGATRFVQRDGDRSAGRVAVLL
jgi:hypothetical protein